MKLTLLLQPVASARGYIVMELPFRAVPEYDLRAADVAFVSKTRWDEVNDGYLTGSPELVIEIIYPSNSKAQVREYAALCLSNGCQEFWAVDHKSKTITVTQRNGQSTKYTSSMTVPLTVLAKGTLPLHQVFS